MDINLFYEYYRRSIRACLSTHSLSSQCPRPISNFQFPIPNFQFPISNFQFRSSVAAAAADDLYGGVQRRDGYLPNAVSARYNSRWNIISYLQTLFEFESNPPVPKNSRRPLRVHSVHDNNQYRKI